MGLAQRLVGLVRADRGGCVAAIELGSSRTHASTGGAMTNTERLIQSHEGLRLKVYDDATGKPIIKGTNVKGNPTIGYGRNLVSPGISEDEAAWLFRQDYDGAVADLTRHFGAWFVGLLDVYQAVLVDMAFNVGVHKLLGFNVFLGLMQEGRYVEAADDLETTLWYKQVGRRGKDATHMLRT